MIRIPKAYYEEFSRRYVCKRQEEYKGVIWTCKGTSKESPTAARKAWQKNYDKKIAEIDNKEDIKDGRIALSQALREWYCLYKKEEIGRGGRPRSQRTVKTDMDTIEQINKKLGCIKVGDINTDILQKYFKELSDTNASQSTLNKRWNMLSMYFNHVCTDGNNPIKKCKKPNSIRNLKNWTDANDNVNIKRAYSDIEMTKLKNELSKPYNVHSCWHSKERGYSVGKALIVCMYEFLRVGEVIELRVKDIDWENNIIHIRRQYDEQNKLIVPPKYGSRRDVPIVAECRDILIEACKNKQQEELLFKAGNIYNPGRVAHEGHVLRNRMRDNLRKACERLGLEQHTIHDLRHDGISWAIRKLPEDPYSIQKWAGHKSLSITLDKYYRYTQTENIASMKLMTGE